MNEAFDPRKVCYSPSTRSARAVVLLELSEVVAGGRACGRVRRRRANSRPGTSPARQGDRVQWKSEAERSRPPGDALVVGGHEAGRPASWDRRALREHGNEADVDDL